MSKKQKPNEYTIALSTSSRFLKKLPYIKREIESVKEGALGPVKYSVLMPKIKRFKNNDEINMQDLQYYFLRQQFDNIKKSDALYIHNPIPADARENYIGGNSFLLMGIAFDNGIPILMNHIYHNSTGNNIEEEIDLMSPMVIGTDFKQLDYILSEKYQKERMEYINRNLFDDSGLLSKLNH